MAHLTYVAALTYKRPQMLQRLLKRWADLRIPEDSNIRFLIVDNDPAESARGTVQSFEPHFNGCLEYVVEPQPGIPAARNRALDVARNSSAKFLCFNDDDAFPDSNWLVALTRCQNKAGAHLSFGPYRPILPSEPLSRWQHMIAVSIRARASFVERLAAREGLKGRILTSGNCNWICDVPWISCKRIRFDCSLVKSGGEDTFFRETVIRAGGRLAWCPNAIVFEHLQPERLNLRYQFRRARAHGINAYYSGRKVFPRILRSPFMRLIVGMGLIVLPVLGRASFILGLQMIGMAVGIFQARWGAESDLYARDE